MRKLVLILEYDGSDFLGWQVQPGARTVQGALEEALQTILQERLRVIGSGRTDTGVHALGQVAHFRTASKMACPPLRRGLNSLLPPDVTVHSIQEAEEAFHARYKATSRLYRYRMLRHASPLRQRYAWHVPYRIDVDRMRRACEPLIGEYDFASFCRTTSSEEVGTRCLVRRIEWIEAGDEIHLEIESNRFLHNMVRAIVGTAVDIGRGRWEPERMAKMLEAFDRRAAGPTAPSCGLCLIKVSYPKVFGLVTEPPFRRPEETAAE
jgi:tRNA pseudouridine38-40 synthase